MLDFAEKVYMQAKELETKADAYSRCLPLSNTENLTWLIQAHKNFFSKFRSNISEAMVRERNCEGKQLSTSVDTYLNSSNSPRIFQVILERDFGYMLKYILKYAEYV